MKLLKVGPLVRTQAIDSETMRARFEEAMAEAKKDWAGSPYEEKWTNRYVTLMTGLSDEPRARFVALDRNQRIKRITECISLGAPLDECNILGYDVPQPDGSVEHVRLSIPVVQR